jgi:hypothetical protein
MPVRYVVIPGQISSKNDGQFHFISSSQLMKLYGVDPRECVVKNKDYGDLGYNFSGLIELRPRYDGDYQIPSRKE